MRARPGPRAAAGAAGTTGTAGRGGTTGAAGTTGVAGTTGAGGSDATGARTAEATCARWKADRANLAEGTWSGNVASCVVGDISADGRANALRLFNMYRWFADLPAVITEASRDAQAQSCALMMDANNMLSHEPPSTWLCYTAQGATGAMTSNISSGPGVGSVASYMLDSGNETTHGHRRIILSNRLGPIGLGSTGQGGASCMQNISGTGNAGKTWVAWPPPGPFPIQAYGSGTRTLSATGWSVQTQRSITLTGATVTVTSAGADRPMTVSQLTGSYGESNAIRLVPMGWTPAADQRTRSRSPASARRSATRSTSSTARSGYVPIGTGATVTVTSAGANAPMTMSQLTGSYGESNAIRLVPMGWTPAAGESYTVTVAGVSTPISYTVDFVDCP